ncbi:hypothetical protein EW146_g5389 [Bondarzewia mesenterica]|uniref:GIT Spa2 homology (SHD) domain-containing protein n=2 Tax=Bondarzewia mesenterica TaxID=1095465 RepID=A0A4S4LRP8_9AGAM|nr:hypothetical protein EW146_g5389 [Bondarzewia mesenterica]
MGLSCGVPLYPQPSPSLFLATTTTTTTTNKTTSVRHTTIMKRSMAGRASPTNTTYSGISNYRTESYRPIKDPAPLDPRLIARTHFEELSRYLASYLAKEPANSRSTARQKLTRLTRQQFQELSTDVYDELVRRKNNADTNEIPYLPGRGDFHPKRNQARQKLATLPTSRFKDLSSDVYYELARRYPEFKEEVSDASMTSPASMYDDYPSPDFPTSPRAKGPTPPPNPRLPPRMSEDRDRPTSSSTRRRPSQDDDASSARRSEDPYGGVGVQEPPSDVSAFRRRPSEDVRDLGRRPSTSASATDSTSTTNAQSAMAKSQVIIPNKSTIAEEEIEVPYGRQARESGSTAAGEDDLDEAGLEDGVRDEDSDSGGGLSALGRRLGSAGGEEDRSAQSAGDAYFDKMSFGRASVASDRSLGRHGSGNNGGRSSGGGGGEEHERLKRDYEFRIATMQSRMGGLEREVEGVAEKERRWAESEARVMQLEGELMELRERTEEQRAAMLAMQKELRDAREDLEQSREREARRSREDEEELQILRERCERLEEERTGAIGGANAEIVDQLRSDMEGLLAEVSDLSRRNDELMTSKDSDLVVIRDMDIQLKEYKRKYEQAKTELRSVKATSQLFLQTPKFDEQLPIAPDGAIPDIHITAFLTAVDSLLSAGRSNAPTRVLTPMKAVVNAVTAILEDVRAHERFDEAGGSSRVTKMSVGEAVDAGVVANETLGYFLARIHAFLVKIGVDPRRLRFRQHMANEMAHYATDCWDAEIENSYGWTECVGCADRAAYDLTVHSEKTGHPLVVRQALKEPIVTEKLVAEFNKKVLGQTFGKDSGVLQKMFSEYDETHLKKVRGQLKQGFTTIVTSEGKKLKLTPEMVTIECKTFKQSIREYTPNVIEPSFGLGRILYVLLEHNFWAREQDVERGSRPESTLANLGALPPFRGRPHESAHRALERQGRIQPAHPRSLYVQTSPRSPRVILSTMFSPTPRFVFCFVFLTRLLDAKNKHTASKLRRAGVFSRVDDSNTSIGKRYARNDELGTPFGVTLDFASVPSSSSSSSSLSLLSSPSPPSFQSGARVMPRERDTTGQLIGDIDVVIGVVTALVEGTMGWAEACRRLPTYDGVQASTGDLWIFGILELWDFWDWG